MRFSYRSIDRNFPSIQIYVIHLTAYSDYRQNKHSYACRLVARWYHFHSKVVDAHALARFFYSWRSSQNKLYLFPLGLPNLTHYASGCGVYSYLIWYPTCSGWKRKKSMRARERERVMQRNDGNLGINLVMWRIIVEMKTQIISFGFEVRI